MEDNKLWTREFIVMAVINFLLTIMFFLLMVTMSTYAINTYDVAISVAGLVASIFVIGSLVGRLLAGRLIANFGAFKVLISSLVFFIVASSAYFFAHEIEILFVTRILQGLVVGVISTATGTISVQVTPYSRKGEGISYYSLSAVLGAAIGPFIGMFFMNLENGFQWIFTMNIIVGLVSLVILKITRLRVSRIQMYTTVTKQPFSLASVIEIKAIPISFLALIIGFGYSSVTSYLAFYSKEIHLVQAASYFFLIHAISVICSRPFTGKLIDLKGANVIVYPCMILFSMGMLLYSQATATWMLLGSAVLLGLGFGNFNSASQTIAVRFASPNRLGIATSTYFMFIDLGFGIGPYVLGFVVADIGFRMLYMCVAFVGFICIPFYYLLYGHQEKASIQQQKKVSVNQS